MKNLYVFLMFAAVLMAVISCEKKAVPVKTVLNSDLQGSINRFNKTTFDSVSVDSFFVKFAELAKYTENVKTIYRGHNYHHIWFDENGLVEFANSLYSKVKGIATEGVYAVFPFDIEIDGIFAHDEENILSDAETEIMITSMFLFYTENVYRGVDDKTTAALEWLLPKKQVSYENMLDSMMQNSGLLLQNDSVLFSQYYKLRDMLKRYRDIQKTGGWDTIAIDPKIKAYQPGDTAGAIVQIRERLFKTLDIAETSSRPFLAEIIPNPVKSNARIDLYMPQYGNLKLQLTDLNGKVIISQNYSLMAGKQTLDVNLENLPSGIYFVSLQDGNRRNEHMKLIKQSTGF